MQAVRLRVFKWKSRFHMRILPFYSAIDLSNAKRYKPLERCQVSNKHARSIGPTLSILIGHCLLRLIFDVQIVCLLTHLVC